MEYSTSRSSFLLKHRLEGSDCFGKLCVITVCSVYLAFVVSWHYTSVVRDLVCIASNMSDLLLVGIGLLFTIFIDRISRCIQKAEGVRSSGLRILSLVFADDVALLTSSSCDLQLAPAKFAASVN